MKYLRNVTIIAFIYYILARLSLNLAYENSNASPIWPPSGFALAMVLILGRNILPGIFVGALVANFITFVAPLNQITLSSSTPFLIVSIVIAVGNSLEAYVGWLLLNKYGAVNFLEGRDELLKFSIIAVFISFLGAVIGTVTLLLGGIIPTEIFSEVVLTWGIGDLAGIIVFTKLIVLGFNFKLKETDEFIEILIFIAVLVIVNLFVFSQSFTLPYFHSMYYMLLPLFLWPVFRFKIFITCLALCITTLFAVLGTVNGVGEFYSQNINESILKIQVFIITLALTVYTLALHISPTEKTRVRVEGF